MNRIILLLALGLMQSHAAAEDNPAAFFRIDCTKAPECETFARRAKALCEEWYPRINELLFGKGARLPYDEVQLTFEPLDVPAITRRNTIRLSAKHILKASPPDDGLVIAELTHVVQRYRGEGEPWLSEGIADYVRYRFFEPGKWDRRLTTAHPHYKQGHQTAAAFLFWIEDKKFPDIVKFMNAACRSATYKREMWQEKCGAPLDDLWAEFIAGQGLK